MIKTKIECDGCGKTVEVQMGEVSDVIRMGVLVSLNGGSYSKYDLCLPCQDTLTRNADPKSWPRACRRGSSYEIGSGGPVPPSTNE